MCQVTDMNLFLFVITVFICLTGAKPLLGMRTGTAGPAANSLRIITLCLGQVFIVSLTTTAAGIFSIPAVLAGHLFVSATLHLHLKRFARIDESRAPARVPDRENPGPVGISGIIAGGCFGSVFLWDLWISAHMPVHMWDDLSYHLPVVASVVSTGSMTPLPSSFTAIDVSLGSIHLLYAWGMLFFRNSHLLSVFHALFLPMGVLASYCAIRAYGGMRNTALICACCAGLTPLYLMETVSAYIDIAVAALFISSLFFIIDWVLNGHTSLLPLAVVIALSTGAKLHSALFTIVLIIWAPLVFRSERISVRSRSGYLTLTGAAIIGGFPYFLRFLRFGNPFFPFECSVFGLEIFRGIQSMQETYIGWREVPETLVSWLSACPAGPVAKIVRVVYSWMEFSRTSPFILHTLTGGFGPFTAVFLLPAAIVSTIAGGRRARVAGVLVALLALTPLAHATRYTPMVPFVLALVIGCARMRPVLLLFPAWLVLIAYSLLPYFHPDIAPLYSNRMTDALEACAAGRPAACLVLWVLPPVVALLLRNLKDRHWPLILFAPAMLIQILDCRMMPFAGLPIPSGISSSISLDDAWNFRPLTPNPDYLAHINAARLLAETGSDQTIVYTGQPFPCAIGLLWDRHFHNRVFRVERLTPEDRVQATLRSIEPSAWDNPGHQYVEEVLMAYRDS